MGFVDVFYYGQGRLLCTSTASADNGKTVSIANAAGRTWSGTLASGKCEFVLPPKDRYTVSLINSGVTEYTTTVDFGFGDFKEVPVGMDATTPRGIKNIVNAGLESDFFTAGDQITLKESGVDATFDVLHVGYRLGTYGHNIILGRHDPLPNTRQMQTTNTNAGGYMATLVASYLDGEYFNNLDEAWRDVISEITFQASVGSQGTALQNEEHKVWLPMEYNIFGATTYAAGTEHTTGLNEQFAYFVSAPNRIKAINGSAVYWWGSSPSVSGSTAFCIVNASGTAGSNYASDSCGVVPCFMIAADAS